MIRKHQTAPETPVSLATCDQSQSWSALSASCGCHPGVTLFEPRNSCCRDLRIQGKRRKKVFWRAAPLAMGSGVFRSGLSFSVKWTSTFLCFSSISNVVFQLFGFSSPLTPPPITLLWPFPAALLGELRQTLTHTVPGELCFAAQGMPACAPALVVLPTVHLLRLNGSH